MSVDLTNAIAQAANPDRAPWPIDRIDSKGNIRGHLTLDNDRTICGLRILHSQDPAGNGSCKRCDKIAADRAARVAREQAWADARRRKEEAANGKPVE